MEQIYPGKKVCPAECCYILALWPGVNERKRSITEQNKT